MCSNKIEFGKLVARRRKLNSLKKKIENQLSSIDEEIIEYAKAKGTVGGKNNNSIIIFGDGYKVSVIEITQHPFDSDKLKAFFGDSICEFQKTNTYSRIDIR